MILQQLKLQNFRNYEKLDIVLSKNLNIFYGMNAQGKTNILEAIYLLALTKSHRTNNDIDMLLDGKKKFKVLGNIKKDEINYNMSVEFYEKKKKLFIDNNEYNKLSEYLSHLNVILFYPDDIEIIKGLPEVRRKFLNNELCQLYPIYYKVLNEYNKLLKMKNDILKKISNREKVDMNYYKILNEYLIEKAIFIYKARKKFIDKLNFYVKSIFYDIAKKDSFQIKYITKPFIEDFDNENLKNFFRKTLDDNFFEEVKAGMSLYGPHRDDFEFLLENKSLKKYGSQGQQKLSVLVLKLAEIPIFELQFSEKPILLLDDIFSEFDKKKKNCILKYIDGNIQTIITTTDLNNITRDILTKSKIYNVAKGTIKEIKR